MKIQPQGSDPRKMVRMAIAFGAVVLVIWVLALQGGAQLADPPLDVRSQERLDSLRVALNKDTPITSARREDNMGSNAFLVFIIMGASLAVLYWYFGKKGTVVSQAGFVKEIAVQELATGGQIMVLEMAGELWIMSSNNGNTSLIEKRPLEDLPFFETEQLPQTSFSNVLKRLGGDRG